jgi:PPM family protein phosphatase
MNLETWGASDIGRSREVNEDAYLLEPELGLVALADGMGGYERGDVAASMALEVLRDTVHDHRRLLRHLDDNPDASRIEQLRALLDQAFQRACAQVYRASQTPATVHGHMGTTLDAALFVGRTVITAHVGDGRIYLYHQDEVHTVTDDHSVVGQQLRERRITTAEAKKTRFRNVVTRALGVFPSVLVDLVHFEISDNDLILLCSDGLHRYVGAKELAFHVSEGVDSETPSQLVSKANSRGGRDNVTVVLARAGSHAPSDGTPVAPTRLDLLRRVDLFRAATFRELLGIEAVGQETKFGPGRVVFCEGDAGRELFLILSGRVSVEKEGVKLATLSAPQYFGEMSFVDQPCRSATVRTLDDCRFLVIRRDHFLDSMRRDSTLAAHITWAMLSRFCRLLRQTNEKIVSETMQLYEPSSSDHDGSAIETLPGPDDEPVPTEDA